MTTAAVRATWSRSQATLFRECRRKYFFQRIEAPEPNATNTTIPWESVPHLRKLTNRHLWSGSVVHETIGGLLESLRQEQPMPSPEDLITATQRRMRDNFRASLHDEKMKGRMFEHEYNVRLSRDAWKSQWEAVENAITRFMNSAWLDRLKTLGPECWKAVNEVLEFDVGGIRAYVKIDCAVEKDGSFTLMDWKTGALRESDQKPLLVAALYAHEVWGADPSAINAVAVSLLDGKTLRAPVDEDSLMETHLQIQEETELFMELNMDETTDPFAIPPPSSLQICARCNFQKICHPKGVGHAM